MQWSGISEFVSVAEAQSFTLAAKKLALSTAQVSRQINALEKRLSTKLFYRTTRKVSLTQEGEVFYQHCRSVLDGLDAAEHAITHLQSMPQGKIKITAPVTYGEQHILPLLNDFMLQHENIEVEAYLSNQQLDLIEGGFDLAIRFGHLADSTLMARHLNQRTSHVCASPAYLETYGVPQTLSQLKQHQCLIGSSDYWSFQEGTRAKHLKIQGKIRYNSGLGLVDAALKGLGIVQLPNQYVEAYIQRKQLVTLLEHYKVADEKIWAVYPQNRHLSPRIKHLVDFLAYHLNPETDGL